MIAKEQIAHDLTMIYLSNRYGANIKGDFSVSDGYGSGEIESEHFPDTQE